MNSRLLTGIAAGCVAGFAGGWFLRPEASPSPDGEKSSVRIAKLESDLKTKSEEVERLTKSAGKNGEPGKSTAEPRGKDRRADFAGRSEGAKQMQERMKRRIEEKQKLKLDERVAVLRKKLGLNDAQAASIRELLEKSPGGPQDIMLRAMAQGESGGKAEQTAMMLDMLRPGQKTAELNAQIAAVLTPEQQEAYTAFRQEQRTNDVEVKANKELARLQSSLTLNQEQKDKAFAVLSKLADEEYDNPVSSMAGLMQQQMKMMPDRTGGADLKAHTEEINAAAELAAQRRKQRVESMREFLSDEQIALYESQQKQNSMADLMDGSLGDITSLMMEGPAPEPAAPGAAPAPVKP